MNVNFTSKDKRVLKAAMEAVPAKDSAVVIGGIMYEITGVKHVWTPTGRGGGYDYEVEVSIRPL